MKQWPTMLSDAVVIGLPAWVRFVPSDIGQKMHVWCVYCDQGAWGVHEDVNDVWNDVRRLFPGIHHDVRCNAKLQDATDKAVARA